MRGGLHLSTEWEKAEKSGDWRAVDQLVAGHMLVLEKALEGLKKVGLVLGLPKCHFLQEEVVVVVVVCGVLADGGSSKRLDPKAVSHPKW